MKIGRARSEQHVDDELLLVGEEAGLGAAHVTATRLSSAERLRWRRDLAASPWVGALLRRVNSALGLRMSAGARPRGREAKAGGGPQLPARTRDLVARKNLQASRLLLPPPASSSLVEPDVAFAAVAALLAAGVVWRSTRRVSKESQLDGSNDLCCAAAAAAG